jgi:type VI protein secretion system component Hcp
LTDAANALEDISFTYQKIEISDPIAKTSAVDTWQA